MGIGNVWYPGLELWLQGQMDHIQTLFTLYSCRNLDTLHSFLIFLKYKTKAVVKPTSQDFGRIKWSSPWSSVPNILFLVTNNNDNNQKQALTGWRNLGHLLTYVSEVFRSMWDSGMVWSGLCLDFSMTYLFLTFVYQGGQTLLPCWVLSWSQGSYKKELLISPLRGGRESFTFTITE